MRCNSNCSCNQNSCNRRGNNGGNFQPYHNQSMDCGYSNGFHGMYRRPVPMHTQCNVFAATTTTPQTVTGYTPTPLTVQNILYNYGCAIQTTKESCKISITQPGLYQVSYFIVASTQNNMEQGKVTVSLMKEMTPISSKEIVLEPQKDCKTVTDTCIVYVACHDIPKCISLHVKNETTAATDIVSYQAFITINRICSCNEASCGALGENTCCCPCNHGCGCFGGYPSYCNGYMTGPFGSAPNYGFGYGMPDRNFAGGCGHSGYNGCSSSCKDKCDSSCNSGCECNSQ